MRVLVCGGRAFSDGDLLSKVLWDVHAERPIRDIIHGGAPGADYLAHVFSVMGGFNEIEFRADWERFGKAAGPMRNQRMIDEGNPDLVIAFPGGRGTADMVRRAHRAGIPVKEITA